MQVNASSIETNLGGGNYSYLGLVLTDQEYTTIPNTELFILPHYPGPLAIPPIATAIKALQLKD